MSLEAQPTPKKPLAKAIKITIVVVAVVLGLFTVGYIKDKPTYEVRKEVAL